MTRRIITTVAAILAAVFLDTLIFPRIGLFGLGIWPDMLMAVFVCLGVLRGYMPTCIVAVATGLYVDIFFGVYIGLSAALLLAAAVAGSQFYGKFYADNAIVPAVTAAFAAFAKEMIMAFVALAAGARFSFLTMFGVYILPCSLLTGGAAFFVYAAVKPGLIRQVKYGTDKGLRAAK